LSYDPEIFK